MGLVASLCGALGALIWLYLLIGHGRFWRADQRLDAAQDPLLAPDTNECGTAELGGRRPRVVAVVPARNEADVVADAVASLLLQEAPSLDRLYLVDDRSEDGTADAARQGARNADALKPGAADRLTVLTGQDRPAGWTGKMWAVHQGVRAALEHAPHPDLLLLTDADIQHDRGLLTALTRKVEEDGVVLASLMVKLHARTMIERFLIPAFVFFFQMLYPFPRVNAPRDPMAGAAGGCMLLRTKDFLAAGGIPAIRGEIIDDCALGRAMKRQGPIFLGLTESARSLRPYTGLGAIWKMVARTAFTQLGYSPLLLAGTILGLIATYLSAPFALVWGVGTADPGPLALGLLTLTMMVVAFRPTLRLYGQGFAWALSLPAIALLYLAMTLDSARRHWLGRGGEWKGRTQGGLGGEAKD